jgi:hypothetical protein
METAVVDTRAGEFRVRQLTDARHEGARTTVVLVNSLTSRMTLNALHSFRKFNDVPTDYVVVDNFSEGWVLDDLVREAGSFASIVSNYGKPQSIKLGHWDSLLNAIGVDIGSRFVRTELGFVCHNDVLACRRGWLRHLESKITPNVRGAAFLKDNGRINAMHVSGYMYDVGLYNRDVADWYPVRGGWDVGDHYTQFLRDRGIDYHVCPCTHNDPNLSPKSDPTQAWTRSIRADRCLDDEGNVVYMHMGRGSLKSLVGYSQPGKTTHEEWVDFGRWIIQDWQG